MSVDLPDPDGPVTATNSPALDIEVGAAERAHGDLADVVRLDEVADRKLQQPWIDSTVPPRPASRRRHRRRRVPPGPPPRCGPSSGLLSSAGRASRWRRRLLGVITFVTTSVPALQLGPFEHLGVRAVG